MIKVLMVCMGNICRSPMAEGVLRRALQDAGLDRWVSVDSAGTHSYHIGDPPDPRAQGTARLRGVSIGNLRGRQVADVDFEKFDYILAMDGSNLATLKRRAPARSQHKLRLFLSFSRKYPNLDVPDPYYGGPQGFEGVMDMIEDGVAGLLKELRLALEGHQGAAG